MHAISTTHSSLSPMVRQHISNELKEMALSMSLQGLSDLEVRDFTEISERSLKRLRSTYWNTSRVLCKSPGRFCMLTAIESKVCRNILLSQMVISLSTVPVPL